MTRSSLVAILAVVAFAAIIFGVIVRAQDEPTPHALLKVGQARYVSTEPALGSIAIDNTTSGELGYSSLSVTFLIRDAAGQQREDHWVKAISHIPGTSWIPAGEHRSFEVTLPQCDVFSDPCTERVAIKLSLAARPSRTITVVTNEVTYTFVPDPSATFRVDGLRDNRPLFITQGEARDSVPQDQLRLEFRFAGEAPANVDNVVGRILGRHGLTIGEVGSDDDGLHFFQASLSGLNSQDSTLSISAAIDDIKHEYGSRAELVSRSFVPDFFAFDQVLSAARDAAHAAAARLALFAGAGPTSYAGGLSGDGAQIQFRSKNDNEDPVAPFVSYQDFVSDEALKVRERNTTPGVLVVRVRSTDGGLGARSTTGSAANFTPPADCNYLGDGLSEVAALTLRTMIASDRPQIFALAATTRQQGHRYGVDPDALALVFARDRARALASQLGVETQTVSLVAQYQDVAWAESRTLVTFGVAMTMANESAAAWRRLVLPKATAPSQQPVPQRVFSPRPIPMPTASPFARTAVLQEPADIVPIDLPDQKTLLSAEGDVRTFATADELRLSVAIDRGDRTQDSWLKDLPNPSGIERQLRERPEVRDAAVQEPNYHTLPVGYQIVVRASDPRSVQKLAALIQSKYARFRVATRLNVSAVLSACGDQVLRAQKASVDQAIQRAVTVAGDEQRRLRRLVLAAAYLPRTGDFCLRYAEPDALDRAHDERVQMPDSRMVTLEVPVKLVFRTYAAR